MDVEEGAHKLYHVSHQARPASMLWHCLCSGWMMCCQCLDWFPARGTYRIGARHPFDPTTCRPFTIGRVSCWVSKSELELEGPSLPNKSGVASRTSVWSVERARITHRHYHRDRRAQRPRQVAESPG
eukprot:1224847-Rhodomonas_salina.1